LGHILGDFLPKKTSGHPDSVCPSVIFHFPLVKKLLSSRVARWFVFKPRNRNLGKFCRALDWKMLVYFKIIWNILRSFGIFYGPFCNVVVIWYIYFPSFWYIVSRKIWQPCFRVNSFVLTTATACTTFH
jgi:hypothetical protein